MRPFPAILVLLGLAACGEGVISPCDEDVTPMAASQRSGLGFSAQDVLDVAGGTHTTTLASHEAKGTPLRITVQGEGEAAWADREPAAGSDDALSAELVCMDALLVPVVLGFHTDDGAFDESWTLELEAIEADVSTFVHRVDVRRLQGTWRPEVEGYSDLRLEVSGRFTGEGTSGVLRLLALPDDGGAEQAWDVTVWPAG